MFLEIVVGSSVECLGSASISAWSRSELGLLLGMAGVREIGGHDGGIMLGGSRGLRPWRLCQSRFARLPWENFNFLDVHDERIFVSGSPVFCMLAFTKSCIVMQCPLTPFGAICWSCSEKFQILTERVTFAKTQFVEELHWAASVKN